MIELKETLLAGERPSCRLERMSLDLTDRALRRKLLADVSARSNKLLVLTEGVIPYLTNQDVADVADDLRQIEKIGFWITDYFSPEAIRFGEKMRARFMRNAPFQFNPKDWFANSQASPPRPIARGLRSALVSRSCFLFASGSFRPHRTPKNEALQFCH